MIIGLQRQLSESSLPPCDFFSFLAPVWKALIFIFMCVNNLKNRVTYIVKF